jgi:hypothetical protein
MLMLKEGGSLKRKSAIFYLAILIPAFAMAMTAIGADEIDFPGKDMAKLDTFEAINLEEADKLYAKPLPCLMSSCAWDAACITATNATRLSQHTRMWLIIFRIPSGMRPPPFTI